MPSGQGVARKPRSVQSTVNAVVECWQASGIVCRYSTWLFLCLETEADCAHKYKSEHAFTGTIFFFAFLNGTPHSHGNPVLVLFRVRAFGWRRWVLFAVVCCQCNLGTAGLIG